jgi:hypothetical protein
MPSKPSCKNFSKSWLLFNNSRLPILQSLPMPLMSIQQQVRTAKAQYDSGATGAQDRPVTPLEKEIMQEEEELKVRYIAC